MNISKLNLINFRNYVKLSINLGENINVFIGNNAQGKTNILESILFLSLTKSYRCFNESDLVRLGASKTIVKGRIKNNDLVKDLEIVLNDGTKSLSINKTKIKKVSNYIANLIVISFTPDDMEIIKSSPSIRRNILNIQISQLSKVYLETYNQYNKLLKTRNEYLKILFTNSLADKSYFDIITDKLIEKAIIIYKMRKKYIDNVNLYISEIYNDINKSNDNLVLKYEPNILINDFQDDNIRDIMAKTYKKNYGKELHNGMTLYGPHRDDFSFYICENNLKLFGSQGQQKLAILAYKLAEINIFKDELGITPVLLFDDIFSELDIKKKNRLLRYIQEGIQSIITTTDLKNINKKNLKDAYIYEVENGKVVRK